MDHFEPTAKKKLASSKMRGFTGPAPENPAACLKTPWPREELQGKVTRKVGIKEEFQDAVDETVYNFFGLDGEKQEELHALEEPEYYEVEVTLDTGASTHAANRIDFPGYKVEESPGSRAGQQFGCAGGTNLVNEGQMTIDMVSPLEGTEIGLCTQVTKVTRPLLSVSKMTEDGKLDVLCTKDRAVVRDQKGKVVATFPKKHGLYVCMMKVRNPRFQNSEPFTRPPR